jgi:hypothetical protein
MMRHQVARISDDNEGAVTKGETIMSARQTAEIDYERMAREHLASIPRPEAGGVAEATEVITFKGSVTFGAVFAWWSLSGNFEFDAGKLDLESTVWGLGLTGGHSWGGGVASVAMSELVGDVGVTVLIIASGGGPHVNLVQVTFWKGLLPVAVFVGAGIGAGLGVGAAGTGKLKQR